nr:glycosyltransferase [Methylobacterium sp. BTF04]
MIAVTHLLGAGHLTRAASLARALAGAGHAVTLVSGGAPSTLVKFAGVRLVQLPPLHVRGTDFGKLLDADGYEAGSDTFAARMCALLETLVAARPDVVVTELFPFGRRALAPEFLALVEAARAVRPRPLILASIRDILVAPEKLYRIATAHDRIAALYDAVLVHGDPALVALDASWPVDRRLASKLRYTGYVDQGGAVAVGEASRAGILVSAGSSAAGLVLLRAAAGAARLRPDLGWCILAGHGVPEAEFRDLGQGLPEGVVARARPDYRGLLARAAVSVSPCGYNTAVDLLVTATRAVLVPFEAGRETEQRLRAECLSARGRARILAEADLTPERLLETVLAAGGDPAPAPTDIDVWGAARAVAIIEELAKSTDRAAPALRAARPDWRPLRAALDAAHACGRPVPVWWRDDDAVTATPALDRLLHLSERFAFRLLVAAIPARVDAALAERLRDAPLARVAVHGLSHANHAPVGAKPAEFGPHRPLSVLHAEATEALDRARASFGPDTLLPVFVPPWNRLAPDLAAALPDLGYGGLSSVPGLPVAGLMRADIHLDPFDWRGTRSLADPPMLVATLAHAIAADLSGPLGLLTHHLVHDELVWAFLEDLLGELLAHPATTLGDPRALFLPPVDELAGAWPSPATAQRARMP